MPLNTVHPNETSRHIHSSLGTSTSVSPSDPGRFSSSSCLAKSAEKQRLKPKPPQSRLKTLKFKQDHRGRLPHIVSRFLGYRPPGAEPPYDPVPIPPFTWLHKLPLRYEVWIFAWIGAFGGILLIEAIMSTNSAFPVLVFGVIESPLAQPRNFVLGHFVSALIGIAVTRLFVLNASYKAYLDNSTFHGTTFINGGLSMATSLLGQLMIGAVHPPAGATGLNAAVESDVVALSWRYLPTVLASSLIMLPWALIINNLGRRRYPIYWWLPESFLVSSDLNEMDESEEDNLRELEEGELRKAEDGGRTAEGLLMERIEGEGGSEKELENSNVDGREEPEIGIEEPAGANMDAGDRERAEGRA